MIGDSNAVRQSNERQGIGHGRAYRLEMDGFNQFIEGNQLLDLLVVGSKYTWYRPNGSAKSRLDRTLVSDSWVKIWPRSRQYILNRKVSDHCALVIKDRRVDWGPKPFRSFDAWEELDGYRDVVRQAWEHTVDCGNDLEKVKFKFKRLKQALKQWREQVFDKKKAKRQKIV